MVHELDLAKSLVEVLGVDRLDTGAVVRRVETTRVA